MRGVGGHGPQLSRLCAWMVTCAALQVAVSLPILASEGSTDSGSVAETGRLVSASDPAPTSSGLEVEAGESLSITTLGAWCTQSADAPDVATCGTAAGIRAAGSAEGPLALDSALVGELIGRVGGGPWFRVGGSGFVEMPATGHFELLFNDGSDSYSDNSGTISIQLHTELSDGFFAAQESYDAGNDAIAELSVDPEGSIYLLGTTDGRFRGQSSAGGRDLFVAKMSSVGQLLWLQQFGSSGQDSAGGIALSEPDRLFVSGETTGPLEGEPLRASVPGDYGGGAFVRELSGQGSYVAVHRIENGNDATAADVVALPSGQVCVAGETSGDLPGQAGVDGGADAFVYCLNPDGSHAWSRLFGGEAWDVARAADKDPAGGVVVVGYDGDTTPLSAALYVRRFSHDGVLSWEQVLDSPGLDAADDVAIAGSGATFVVGSTYDYARGSRALALGLDPNGSLAWSSEFAGSSAGTGADAVAIDPEGNPIVTGSTGSALPGACSIGDRDAFVRSFESDGSATWTTQFGTEQADEARGIAVDAWGNLYVGGSTDGVFGAAEPDYTTDAYVAKLDPNGELVWVRQLGSGRAHQDEVTTFESEPSSGGLVGAPTGHSYLPTDVSSENGVERLETTTSSQPDALLKQPSVVAAIDAASPMLGRIRPNTAPIRSSLSGDKPIEQFTTGFVEGDRVAVVMRSIDFATYLFVDDPGEFGVGNDVEQPDLHPDDSYLEFVATKTGCYTVFASSRSYMLEDSAPVEGDYVIEVRRQPADEPPDILGLVIQASLGLVSLVFGLLFVGIVIDRARRRRSPRRAD